MLLTHMTLKLEFSPVSPPPGKDIDPLVSDILGYHGFVTVDCYRL